MDSFIYHEARLPAQGGAQTAPAHPTRRELASSSRTRVKSAEAQASGLVGGGGTDSAAQTLIHSDKQEGCLVRPWLNPPSLSCASLPHNQPISL